MKKLGLSIIAFLFLVLSSIDSQAHKVENLKVKQLKNKISVLYDITQEKLGEQFHVNLYYSTDGGSTFKGPLDSLKGDFGNGITGGTDKVIVWDVLAEVPNLIGENIVFKVEAQPAGVVYPTDQTEGFNFELRDCKRQNGSIEVEMKITNTGDQRDLRVPNRLVRLYDFNNTRLEAQSSFIGAVKGTERHSQPQATFKKNQTVYAKFIYHAPPTESSRMKILQIGFDALEITYGLDVNPGKVEFRDFPVSSGRSGYLTEATSQPQAFKIGDKIQKPKDTEAPVFTFTKPALDNDKPPVIETSTLKITGNVTDESGVFHFKVNNIPVDLENGKQFSTTVNLKEGFNEIIVNAADIEENSIEKKYVVLHLPSKNAGKEKLREIAKREAETKQTLSEGAYYALIIGENEYDDPLITDLDNPINDAQKLKNALAAHYNFSENNITVLENATRGDIMTALDRLNDQLTEQDNVLIFYAGHGYWDAENEVGYWLPTDSRHDNTANWFRNSTLREYIHSFDSRHTLVIADACFSGSIFKTRKAFADAPQTILDLYKLPSRKAMTSGNLREVPDQSVFIEYLIKRLTENQKKYITTEELFNSFKVAVMNNSPNEPQFGDIKNTGDEGGDFIFVRKDLN
jgi:hypothetical protein